MNKIKKFTLTDRIYHQLRSDIVQQTLAGGTTLLYKTLQEEFNVSTSPIREAMNRLYKEGLVTFDSNKSVKVIDFSESDIYEVYHLMRDLEAIALSYALRTEPFNDFIHDLEENLHQSIKFLKLENYPSLHDSTDEFHNIIYTYSNNSRLHELVNQIRGQFSILNKPFENNNQMMSVVLSYHEQIIRALKHKTSLDPIIAEYFNQLLSHALDHHRENK